MDFDRVTSVSLDQVCQKNDSRIAQNWKALVVVSVARLSAIKGKGREGEVVSNEFYESIPGDCCAVGRARDRKRTINCLYGARGGWIFGAL